MLLTYIVQMELRNIVQMLTPSYSIFQVVLAQQETLQSIMAKANEYTSLNFDLFLCSILRMLLQKAVQGKFKFTIDVDEIVQNNPKLDR